MNDAKSQRPWAWDAIGSLRLKFTASGWNEPLDLDPNDTIYHHLPPVASLDLSLPKEGTIETIDEEAPQLYIPVTFLAHLTTLTLKCDWEGNSIITALQSCINLESFTLDSDASPNFGFDEDEFSQPLLEDGLVLPKLRTLRFRHVQEEPLAQFLDLVNAPMLEDLDICFNYWDGGEKPDSGNMGSHILAAINRGGCALQRLRLHFVALDNEELLNLLKKLPSLKHLCLENVTFDLNVFRELKSKECLRNLEVLELVDPQVPKMGKLYHLLCDFLQAFTHRKSRPPKRIPSSVKKFRLVLREPEPLDFQYLEREGRRFRSDGMEVSFSSIPHDTFPLSHVLLSNW
jgi:hypothetical protein